jgi:hypothetical protein
MLASMDKIAIPCSCGCSVLVIMEWDAFQDEPQQFFVEFFTAVDPRASRRERISAAWRVLRGKNPWLHDVALDPNAIAELRNFINKNLPARV